MDSVLNYITVYTFQYINKDIIHTIPATLKLYRYSPLY